MLFGQIIIGFNNLVKIRLHELKHNVDVFELSPRRGEHNVLDFDYVRMPQEPEEFYLPEDPGGVWYMLEDVVYFLDGDFLAGKGVYGWADDSVAAFSDYFLDFEPAGVTVVRKELHL